MARLRRLADGVGGQRGLFRLFYFVHFAALSGFAIFRNVYLEELGMTGWQMGIVGFVFTIAGVVAQPLWGVVTDWADVGRVVVTVCSVGAGVAVLSYPAGGALANPFALVLVGTGLLSVFRAPIVPIANALVLDRGIDYGNVRAFGSIAFGIGSLGFGVLVASLGTVSVVYFFALGMFALGAVARGFPASGADQDEDEPIRPLALVANPTFVGLLVVAFLVSFVSSGGSAYFALYVRDLGVGDSFTGLAWAVKTAFEALAFLYVVRLDVSHRHLLVVGCLGAASTALVYAVFPVAPAILAVQVAGGLGFATFRLASVNVAHGVAGSRVKSTAQTVLSAVGIGAGSAVGQAVAGRLMDAVGLQRTYLYLAVVGFAAAGVGLVLGRLVGAVEPTESATA